MTEGSRPGDEIQTAQQNQAGDVTPQFSWPVRLARFGVKWVSVAYAFALVIILATLEWGGKHWFVGALTYLPPQGWLLPVIVLLPLSLLFRPSLAWLHLGAVLLVSFGYMRWHSSSLPDRPTPGLTLLCNNIGQRNLQDLRNYVQKVNPDVVVLQDAGSFSRYATFEFRDRAVAVHGEFLIASRLPIRSSGFVPGLEHQGRGVAAWFDVVYGGRSVIIYNVHMPTPRPHLLALRSDGFRESLGRDGIWSPQVREEYAEYWAKRLEMADRLIAVLQNERRPFLVVGDFNMTDHGYLFRQFNSRFLDAFSSVGRGYGFTFSATAKQPITFHRPWMRLDYLFAGPHWKPVLCEVEPGTEAQHLAVVGRFALSSPP